MTCNKVKGPDEVLDYEQDYATVMAQTSPEDIISTSTWTADNGVIVDSESETTTKAMVWLSGGRSWTYATIQNTITTRDNRTYTRQMILEIRPR